MRPPRRKESPAERRARRAEVDDPMVILEAALRFLEVRARSVAEVRRRLTGAGYREELVSGAIERLSELGMLDDEAFAAAWVESRDRAHPRSTRALRMELRLKGIEANTIDRTMERRRDPARDEQGSGASADEAAAHRLLARHAAALRRIADVRVRRSRAYATLARHGFDPDVCGPVVTAWMAGEAGGSPETVETVETAERVETGETGDPPE